MALGKSSKGSSNSIFVDLKSNPAKGESGVGFRQTLSFTANPEFGKVEGAKKNIYEYAMHNFVEGHVAGFVTKEEPNYDDPKVNDIMGYATFTDPEGGPNVVVKFNVLSTFGRKVVGLLNAAKDADPVVHLYTSHAAAGAKIGDGEPLARAQSYINARRGDVKGERFVPLYAGPDGLALRKPDGTPAQLPMGTKHIVARKEIWSFEEADEVAINTAVVLVDHYKALADAHAEANGAAPTEDGGVDLNEAASAAAPRP